jgi:hypothetical protein
MEISKRDWSKAKKCWDDYVNKEPNHKREDLVAIIAKALACERERVQKDHFRRIQYCGFGAMEWRMKLIEKLKKEEVIVKAHEG